MSRRDNPASVTWRRMLVLSILLAAMGGLAARAVQLQYFEEDFLRGEGEARHLRVTSIPAHRGMITDRRGDPLAVSTPVDSIWAEPAELLSDPEGMAGVEKLLGLGDGSIRARLTAREGREFVYIRRHVNPDLASQVEAQGAAGIHIQREYRRYYPASEVTSHVLGFTDIDDRGLEGMELVFDGWLQGEPGAKQVIRDRLGRTIEDVEQIRASKPGRDLRLSLDRRIQYLAYRELKAAVHRHGASSGSVVVLEPDTGEVLAMVNQPSINPNNRDERRPGHTRNRAVTDVFEPGSTIKPFTVAAALDTGKIRVDSVIDTAPGWHMVRGHTIQDLHDYGALTPGGVLMHSSNVGACKIGMAIAPERLWDMYSRVGFGAPTGSGFAGESGGVLSDPSQWREVERATLSFGYGLSATPLQLARAYGVLATDGRLVPVSFLPRDEPEPGERVLSAETARAIRGMLEGVVSPTGTAVRASVDGYRVAGKTGTIHKSTAGGYAKDRYVSAFVGMAPASRPRLVIVVVIDEPVRGGYYGGQVAAPVFSRIMSGALRLLNVNPDGATPVQARGDDPEGKA
ncbi:MAG: penicillin-binding transpeptidase domain-containing protein [Pseudomonadota bacterium]|nr:penicillin-binding transpeptidase domain-containing protein [Pseudomonadota bacterium]